MRKHLVKGLAIAVVGVGAIAVCYGGYKVNGQRQYEQRVQYANKAIDKSQSELTALEETINQFYEDEGKTFLRADLSDSDIATARTKLDGIKANAEEYGIQSKDLKDDGKAIEETREQLETELGKAQNKLSIQNQTSALFESPISSWKEAVNDVIIKEDTGDEAIGKVRESLKLSKIDDGWSTVIQGYLDFANAQVTRVKEIRTSLDSMLKDGQITEAATYESYLNLADSISQVRNTALKDKFTADLTTIANQLGTSSADTSDTSTTEESSYSDSTSNADTTYSEPTYSEPSYSEPTTGADAGSGYDAGTSTADVGTSPDGGTVTDTGTNTSTATETGTETEYQEDVQTY